MILEIIFETPAFKLKVIYALFLYFSIKITRFPWCKLPLQFLNNQKNNPVNEKNVA